MSTIKDDPSIRNITTLSSRGRINFGMQDPSGEYPKREYWYSTNLPQEMARGVPVDLSFGQGIDTSNLPLTPKTPTEYGLAQVINTISGHTIKIDDTHGGEHIIVRHNNGMSGIEIRPDGTVLISTGEGSLIEVVGDDLNLTVNGNADLTYGGNVDFKVAGNLNFDVRGNYSVNAFNKTENLKGSSRSTINGNQGIVVKGNRSLTVIGAVVNTFLTSLSNNIKGLFSNNVDGPANYVASGNTTVTSQTRINMSTEDLNIAATSASVFGATGTFGGEGIVFYGKGGTFGEGVQAPCFIGDLTGKADNANQADYATTAGQAPLGSAGSPGTNSHTDAPSTALPNGSNITSYLSRSAGGIRRVSIDPSDFIKNSYNRSVDYAGVSDSPLTTTQARSRLRSTLNRSNQQLVSTLIAENTISPTMFSPSPPGIGRTSSRSKQIRIDAESLSGETNSFLPSSGIINIVPDPVYNPDNQSTITAQTKLAKGITIATFLGAKNDSTNLDFLRNNEAKKSLARQLYLQGTMLKTIQSNTGRFRNLRLVVSEGVYRPGPTENIVAGDINDLKLKGRAVVYEIYNVAGKLDVFNTYDLAEYWMSTSAFDKLILSYDTMNPDKSLHAEVVVIMPELTSNWRGTFSREVETQFNGVKLAQAELVEVLRAPSDSLV